MPRCKVVGNPEGGLLVGSLGVWKNSFQRGTWGGREDSGVPNVCFLLMPVQFWIHLCKI
jgi:hypothetical protein